ncbi:MAG: hypothetical protein ACYC35_13060 [Pirellulales bacterium]
MWKFEELLANWTDRGKHGGRDARAPGGQCGREPWKFRGLLTNSVDIACNLTGPVPAK